MILSPLLIAGLGNPGENYRETRHNIGFQVIDALATRYAGDSPQQRKFQGLLQRCYLPGASERQVHLFKPHTYMNRSGIAVSEAARFYKISPECVTVIHDELDLPLGKIRVKTGGGHGGHNGLKSIDAHLGNGYRRLRIGIAHPGRREAVTGYVLGCFSKDETPLRDAVIDAIVAHLPLLAQNQDSEFMNRCSRTLKDGISAPGEKT